MNYNQASKVARAIAGADPSRISAIPVEAPSNEPGPKGYNLIIQRTDENGDLERQFAMIEEVLAQMELLANLGLITINGEWFPDFTPQVRVPMTKPVGRDA